MIPIPYGDPRLEPLRKAFRAVQDVQAALESIRITDIGRRLRDDPTDPLSGLSVGFTAPIAALKAALCGVVPIAYCELCGGKGCETCKWIGYEFGHEK